MALEVVIEAILEKARKEATEVVNEAKREAEKTLAAAREEGEKIIEQRKQDASLEAERLNVQELARAELESKRIVLVAQKEVLDEVLARARARLAELSNNVDVLRALLKKSEKEWKEGKVYSSARSADVVRGLVGSRFAGTVDCLGGLVIESADGKSRTDLRYETILAEIWRDSVREVAETIWQRK